MDFQELITSLALQTKWNCYIEIFLSISRLYCKEIKTKIVYTVCMPLNTEFLDIDKVNYIYDCKNNIDVIYVQYNLYFYKADINIAYGI